MATHPPISHHFSTDQRQQVTITARITSFINNGLVKTFS
jgi:hypothetical protein